MRLLPDHEIATLGDLIDYLKECYPQDAELIIRLMEEHFDELMRAS